MTWDMTLEELAEKQYKELQNGRLAMLAFAGTAAPWHPWWHRSPRSGKTYIMAWSGFAHRKVFKIKSDQMRIT
jgi:hypothetical protein